MIQDCQIPKISVGVDIVEIEQVRHILSRNSEAFIQRLLSDEELSLITEWKESIEVHLAGRIAAKEAILKAIGVGLKLPLKEISIIPDCHGKPNVVISGQAREAVNRMNICDIQISISHTASYAICNAIALRGNLEMTETINKTGRRCDGFAQSPEYMELAFGED